MDVNYFLMGSGLGVMVISMYSASGLVVWGFKKILMRIS